MTKITASDAMPAQVYRFTVPGQPTGKARARIVSNNGRIMAYTPESTVVGEEEIRRYAQVAQVRPIVGPVVLTVRCYMRIPERIAQVARNRKAMEAGTIRPTPRPDWDNIGKLVSDALNHIAYQDDSQVVEAHVEKWYSYEPRTEIEVRSL